MTVAFGKATPETEATGGKILVVDDEKVIREILCEFLTLEGFEVDSVSNGSEAISRLRIRNYDMVISDLKMPKKSGLELLATIQEEDCLLYTSDAADE